MKRIGGRTVTAAVAAALLFVGQPASAGSHLELKPQLKLQSASPQPVPKSSGEEPSESVNLKYAPLDLSYQEQEKDGSKGQPTTGYDVRPSKQH
jgi:hypothetical protein